jgi:zinc transport system ATP-binding protein
MSGIAPFDLAGGNVVLARNRVLQSVDFRIGPGEFVVLLGPNGSGKSTLVRTLLGLIPLSSGMLRIFGKPVRAFREWARVGYVPQRFTAVSGVPATVGEVVVSGRIARSRFARPYGRADKEAAGRALRDAGLAGLEAVPVASLSGGQQQRVLIARALAGDPDVLVLDEPVSGVDLEHQESFASTLRTLNRGGRSVLLVAHALGALEPLVERAVVLQLGRIVYDGPPLEEQVHVDHVHHHPHLEVFENDLKRTGGRS